MPRGIVQSNRTSMNVSVCVRDEPQSATSAPGLACLCGRIQGLRSRDAKRLESDPFLRRRPAHSCSQQSPVFGFPGMKAAKRAKKILCRAYGAQSTLTAPSPTQALVQVKAAPPSLPWLHQNHNRIWDRQSAGVRLRGWQFCVPETNPRGGI